MIPSLYYLDRYRNEETRTYSKHSSYTEAENEYRPDGGADSFTVQVFEISRKHVELYLANPPKALSRVYLPGGNALVCVHPQVLKDFGDDVYVQTLFDRGQPAPGISVVPSSSTRTLYVDGDNPHALKVHFPFRVSRYGRKMRDEVIEQAIRVSMELEEGIGQFDERFGFLREVIGIALKNKDESTPRGENWGYLVRDMVPFPSVNEKRSLVPGFALYGKDFFNKNKPPLLYELIKDHDPLEYILEDIMLPIVSQWIRCVTSFGFILEPHGQNVLLEVDGNKRVKRIIHRDLSTGIDMRRRKANGLSSDHLNNYNRMDYGEFNSIAYDMFMGSHFFDRIVKCVREKYPKVTATDFQLPCKELFRQEFTDHENYLPRTVHYFSEKRDQFNKPLYQDTGRSPDWRP